MLKFMDAESSWKADEIKRALCLFPRSHFLIVLLWLLCVMSAFCCVLTPEIAYYIYINQQTHTVVFSFLS